MKDKLRLLADLRDEVEILLAQKRDSYAAWVAQQKDLFLALEAHQAVLVALEAHQAVLVALEAQIREEALAIYATTKNKAVCPGVAIREVVWMVYDPAVAYLWALEHKMALNFDTRKFEAIAKCGDIPFVERKFVPQATISQDLGKALGEMEEK